MALNTASQRVAGTLYLAINGVTLALKGQFTAGYGVEQKTEVMGLDGFHGYKGEARAAFIQGTITNKSDLNVKQLLAAENVTVTAQFQGGKTLTLRNAFQAGPGELNGDEGELVVKFVGPQLEET